MDGVEGGFLPQEGTVATVLSLSPGKEDPLHLAFQGVTTTSVATRTLFRL